MADNVNVPGVGQVKKTYAIAGVGVVGGVLIFAYWRRSQQATTPEPAATAPAAGDAGLTDYYSQTGDAGYGNVIYPPIQSGTFNPYGYDIYGNPLPAPTGATGTGGTFTSNAEWAQAAVDWLEKQGATEAVASAAISKVLGGLVVTVDQQNLFLQAIGVLGQPPQGYPAIKLVDTPSSPKPPTAPSGSTLAAPKNLRATGTSQSSVSLDWDPVPGAIGYSVFSVADPAGGGTPTGKKQTSVVYSLYTVKGLTRGKRYRFDVHALGQDGKIGARARVYATTKK